MNMNIVFIAYYFSEADGVGSLRSRCLARMLEERDNHIFYFTKHSFGNLAASSKLMWCFFIFYHLLKSNIGKVYISCGPFWHLPFILLACQFTNKRFICDFRDPWSLNIRRGYGNSEAKVNPVKVLISEIIEKLIYKSCYRFWVCTPGMYDLYTNLFKDNNKLDLIPNGYDFDSKLIRDIKIKEISNATNKINLVCLGKFADENPKTARTALKQLKESYLENNPYSLVIDFIGTPLHPTYDLVCELGLEKNCNFHAKMPYLEAIKLASKADMGLCVIRDEEFDLGTKAFDYIGLGLPIYNCFQENSNFFKFFQNFLSKDGTKNFDFSLAKNYSRASFFRKKLVWIDEKYS